MPLENSPDFIADLDATWPEVTDIYTQGDNHIRQIKDVLKTQFPGLSGQGFDKPITVTAEEINHLSGVTSNLVDQYLEAQSTFEGIEDSVPAPYGTVCLFNQPEAPAGWEQIVTYDDYQVRIVNTAGGGSGGSDSPFSFDWDHTHTTAGFPLTHLHIPSHTHNILTCADVNGVIVNSPEKRISVGAGAGPLSSGDSLETTGSGDSHSHGDTISSSLIFSPKYLNTILARCITIATTAPPTPTVYWSLDTNNSGQYYADTDTADNRLNVTGTVNTSAGLISNAASFSGNAANYLQAAGGGTNRVEELDVVGNTLSCWVKVSASHSASAGCINNCYRASGPGNSYNGGNYLYIDSSGYARASYNVLSNESYMDSNGNSSTTYTIIAKSAGPLPTEVWIHLTGVFGLNSAQLYINGELNCTVTSSGNARRNPGDSLTSFNVGALRISPDTFHPLDGLIDEVKCWDSELTPSQVLGLYDEYF